jgi:hypothetical protein
MERLGSRDMDGEGQKLSEREVSESTLLLVSFHNQRCLDFARHDNVG